MRELTRYRESLVREQSAVANRIQKVIESGNIKLGQVASDALGASGRKMLWALARGETDPVKLAALAQRQLKAKIPQLQRALQGRLTTNQRFVLRELLQRFAAACLRQKVSGASSERILFRAGTEDTEKGLETRLFGQSPLER